LSDRGLSDRDVKAKERTEKKNDCKKYVDKLPLVNGAMTPDYYLFGRLLHFLDLEM